MLIDEVAQIMDEYLNTVSPEQFKKDLEEAGILDCPDTMSFDVVANTGEQNLCVSYKAGKTNSIKLVGVYDSSINFNTPRLDYFYEKDIA